MAEIDFAALAGADLSDMKWMPLDIARLRRSKAWLFAKKQPELAFYMVNLWTAAWHERPPGSLEHDDDVLCDAAMCDPKRWPAVREKVLHGWVEHAGRIYHPVVCEKAAETWAKKADYRRRTQEARDAKKAKRTRAPSDHDRPETDYETEPVTRSVTEPATALKGEGQGEGQGDSSEPYGSSGAAAPPTLPVVDPKRVIFGDCLAWLMTASGRSESASRTLLGQWVRDHGDAAVIQAFQAASRDPPAGDAVAWIEGILQRGRGNGSGRGDHHRKTPGSGTGMLAAFAKVAARDGQA